MKNRYIRGFAPGTISAGLDSIQVEGGPTMYQNPLPTVTPTDIFQNPKGAFDPGTTPLDNSPVTVEQTGNGTQAIIPVPPTTAPQNHLLPLAIIGIAAYLILK